MDQKQFLFDTKTPKGINDAIGFYEASVLGMMKELVKDVATYDTSVFILAGPRGYDSKTLFEPYGNTRDVISWFATLLSNAKSELARKAVADEKVSDEDTQYIENAENMFGQILDWYIAYLDPRAVLDSIASIPNIVIASYMTGARWIQLFLQIDVKYPTYIVSPESILNKISCRFPSISAIISAPFSRQMRTNIILATMAFGREAFEDITNEPIFEISNWFIRSFSADVDTTIGKPYVFNKIDINKLLCYVYRSLISMGDVDATIKRYNDSLAPDSPESLVDQVERFKDAVCLNRDSYLKLAKKIIENTDSNTALKPDTYAFILTIHVPESNAAYPIYDLIAQDYTKKDNKLLLSVSASVHFNSPLEIASDAAKEYEPSVVAALRLSLTRYFDGLLSESKTLFSEEERTSIRTLSQLADSFNLKIADFDDEVKELQTEYDAAIEEFGKDSKEAYAAYVDLDAVSKKTYSAKAMASTVSKAIESLSAFSFLDGYNFVV